MTLDQSCKACDARTQAGLEGKCPACANERARAERDDVRLTEAVADAEEAFWIAIARSYPEATSGDFSASTARDLKQMMSRAVAEWLELNVKQ